MADPVLQHTSPTLGDCVVLDDNTTTVDGVPSVVPIVTTDLGLIRVDVDGNGIINANDAPWLATVRCDLSEMPGPNNVFTITLTDWAETANPDDIYIVVYPNPDGNGGASVRQAFAGDPKQLTIPPGLTPPVGEPIFLGYSYGPLPGSAELIAAFTMYTQWDTQTFSGGGDW